MQDQIIPCKHDFILKLRLDMQMSYIFRLVDETASNMMLSSLAREMYEVETDSRVCCDRRWSLSLSFSLGR
jgi:hypothetical protein